MDSPTHGASTALNDEAIDIYIAPDEQLVAFKSKNGARCQILDVTTGCPLFTLVDNITSVAFSLTSVACLRVYFNSVGSVEIWDTHNCRLNSTIKVDNDILNIALSPDDSRLVSLSPRHVKLWDLETKECLAHLEFDSALGGKAGVSFASHGASVSVEHNGRSRWWHISPASHINWTTSVLNSDGTKSWLICDGTMSWLTYYPWTKPSGCRNEHRMVFVPITEKQSNQDAPQQSYCDKDGEWMLDQHSRRVLWIPPDERPQETKKHGRVTIIRTESGKNYIVIPPSP
jgi:hypothetical protein